MSKPSKICDFRADEKSKKSRWWVFGNFAIFGETWLWDCHSIVLREQRGRNRWKKKNQSPEVRNYGVCDWRAQQKLQAQSSSRVLACCWPERNALVQQASLTLFTNARPTRAWEFFSRRCWPLLSLESRHTDGLRGSWWTTVREPGETSRQPPRKKRQVHVATAGSMRRAGARTQNNNLPRRVHFARRCHVRVRKSIDQLTDNVFSHSFSPSLRNSFLFPTGQTFVWKFRPLTEFRQIRFHTTENRKVQKVT